MTNIANTVLYTGITNDLIRRAYGHKNKLIEGFTKKYNVTKLVYYEIFSDSQTAIEREKSIKNLLRVKKIALIKSMNLLFKDLYQDILAS